MSEQRYPINIRLIGVIHKDKIKMFMTSVLWSDQSDIIVYRSFQDFKKLHKQLKKSFPTERSFRKSDRVIPKFKETKTQKGYQNKGPSKYVVRLKSLEKYCYELLKCDPRVTQSSEVSQFLLPNAQDLQPDFAKNSIVVMPPEDVAEGGGRTGGMVGNVTQPFVTETYRCVAPYDTKDTKNRPFKVAMDEKVDVLIKDKAGWWLVENDSKCMAWFPAPYLERCDDEEEDEDERSDTPEEGVLFRAVKNFKASKGDEVSVSIGSVVEVLQRSDNGWWLVRYKGKVGYVPTMYLQPYSNPQVRMVTLQKEMWSSTLNLAQLQVPGGVTAKDTPTLAEHAPHLSRSHGNLLSPGDRQPRNRRLHDQTAQRIKSRSLESVYNQPQSGSALPAITVETAEEEGEEQRERLQSSQSSEDGSEFSFSDDSSVSDTLSLSLPDAADRMRRSLTPQPHLDTPDDSLAPSRSDPNLFKRPTTPKVPPRPRAQEILARCTTITRKAAAQRAKAPLDPAHADMQAR